MKKVAVLLHFLLSAFAAAAQVTPDSRLLARMDSFFAANHQLDLDKIPDYTYPRLFTIATREEMREALEETFKDDEVAVQLDSMKAVTFFPEFKWESGRYMKIKYSFIMRMKFLPEGADTDTTGAEDPLMLTAEILKSQYGTENVSMDKASRTIRIYQQSSMVAVKNDISPEWTFTDLENNPGMLTLLFDQKLVDKLAEYN